AAGIFGCAKGIVSTVRSSLIVKWEVNALMTGGMLPMENKIREEEINNYTKVRFSLKKKLSLFTVALLMLIIAAVALTIGSRLSRIQEQTLIDGLKNRVQIAFGSISSGCQMNMQDLLDLSDIESAEEKASRADEIRSDRINPLVSITDNFNEAEYAIVLSYNIDNYITENAGTKAGEFDYVWAASSSTPSEIIDQMEIDGRTRIKSIDGEIPARCDELRREAREKLADLRNRNATPGEIRQFFNDYSRENFGAVPYFNEDRLDKTHTEYTFFWPIFDPIDSDLLGVALMEVDTHALISSVNGAKKNILIISISAAVVALIIGIISALSLASVIVNPIKKVVAHVQGITNEKDKEKLAGIKIEIKSHDEIRTLGDEVNKMTENLVEGARSEKRAKKAIEESARAREAQAEAQKRLAAEAQKTAEAQQKANEILKESLEKAKMDNDGKIVQKSLVPLNKGRGEKESVASFKDSKIDLYCYYEGADDVSGDYFNYKKLDDRWYAVIKCDVSGHGIPAALLVAVVSTLFGEYFSNWSFKTHGTRINELITKINETVCSYELTGKFVAVFLALIDTKSGDVYMCNAGDSIVHHYDSKSKTQKELHLNIIPATGMFDQFMIDMRGGYQVEKKLVLNKGDVLFLYTDGIEESVRFFRDENFNVISCTETKDVTQGKGPRDLVHKTHNVGTQSEELGNDRIKDIVEAVYNKKKYVLHKYHSPRPKEILEFDFSKCDGTIEDSILALAAIDKIFRFYKKPDAKGSVQKTDSGIVIDGDGIRIDRKIDAFLKKTFSLYDYYCHDQVDMGEQNYIYYVNLNEDVQADDLTIFAVKRL
ncbi:MAG: SpoIIE family protein phosphatase, partial [Treponema sp.]|nr:SpoIIE family protein phosphatase [Treponema sp.]